MIDKSRVEYFRDLCKVGMAPYSAIREQHGEAAVQERDIRQRLARRFEHIEFEKVMKAKPDELQRLILAPIDERELDRAYVAARNSVRREIADIKSAHQRVEMLARRLDAEKPRRDALGQFLGNLNTLAEKYGV